MTLAAVRAEIVTNLKTVDPISGRSYGYAPDDLKPPTGFVAALQWGAATLGDTSADVTGSVFIVESRSASTERGVDKLDTYAQGGANDIHAAISGPGTAYDSLEVTGAEWPVSVEIGAATFVAIRFDFSILL